MDYFITSKSALRMSDEEIDWVSSHYDSVFVCLFVCLFLFVCVGFIQLVPETQAVAEVLSSYKNLQVSWLVSTPPDILTA